MITDLISQAFLARKNAYAPYSKFFVGAALLTADGKIFLGCNVENSSYSPTCCAERTAFYNAVSQGYRKFKAIAIVGGFLDKPQEFCPPCGVCRQVMQEFCDRDFEIILAKDETNYKKFTLAQLLPEAFFMGDDNNENV